MAQHPLFHIRIIDTIGYVLTGTLLASNLVGFQHIFSCSFSLCTVCAMTLHTAPSILGHSNEGSKPSSEPGPTSCYRILSVLTKGENGTFCPQNDIMAIELSLEPLSLGSKCYSKRKRNWANKYTTKKQELSFLHSATLRGKSKPSSLSLCFYHLHQRRAPWTWGVRSRLCVKTVVVSLARCETCQIHFPRVKGEGMRSLQGGRISRGHPSQLSASRQPRPRLSLPPLSPSAPGASSRAVTSSEPQQPLLSNGFWGKHSSLAPEPPCPSLRLLKVILSPWL